MLKTIKRNGGATMKESKSKIRKVMNTCLLETPIKSKSDRKEYRLIYLENGLKALLIQHKAEENSDTSDDHNVSASESEEDESASEGEEEGHEREKLAAVALSIGTGSFNDPNDIQGLAHFVEHMIFMGSEKYPKENELDQYLSANGGGSNALTECEHTLFYFDVVEEHLSEAMNRFSSLFVAPLMLPDSISREIEAIESEFQNNVNDDDSRIVQLFASKGNGPASTFTWGNLKTLKEEIDSDKLYAAAHEFRSKYYVANNMYLCVESSESLDSLQNLVEKNFSEIKTSTLNENRSSLSYLDYFKSDFHDKIFYIKPKSDKYKLLMTFVMPSMKTHYKSKPHDYLAYIIQHEGSGSLSSYFKRNLLALHVEAGVEDQSFEGNSLYTLFGIDILLTEKGYNNIEVVLQAIFSVLLMLKNTPFENHEKAYLELKKIRDTSFDYQEEKTSSENTEDYAVNMIYYDAPDIITGSDKFFHFDGKMVKELIEILNEGKFNLLILTDKHHQYPKIEKWFGTEYDELDFPENIRKLWNNRQLSSDFFMPLPNEFICSNFDIVYNKSQENRESHCIILPEKIKENLKMELWYKLDSKFLLPHGFINCYLETPNTFKNARNMVLTSMFSLILKYYLDEKLYPAICAGLGYSINAAEKGLLIKLSGYNEKLLLLLDIITKELKEIPNKIESKVFETFREQCRKNGYNNLINSKFVTRDLRLSILENQHQFCLDQYAMTEDIKFDDIVNFATSFLEELYVKIMILGNFDKSEAYKIADKLNENLKITKNIDKKLLVSRARKIPKGLPNMMYVKSFLPDDKNSTITNYYQIGRSTIKTQCLIEFIEKLMQEPLFDILRTKEQFGYSVSCSHRVNNGIIGFTITLQVQEEKHSTISVNERVEKFLNEDFKDILLKLTVDEFEANQSSLIKLKMMEEVEMEHENNRLFSEISSDEYLFTRLDFEAEMIGRLKLKEVQEFYNDILLKAPKLSIQVIGVNEKKVENTNVDNNPKLNLLHVKNDGENIILDINAFKDSMDLFEEWKTVVDL
ncbi:unnamed protein product [Chironomus riparius]|uniref:Nardilysin n=1 Tax=Chironomus riparius TaxID=315576 RepID=A0A9N9S2I3_9DIPT|nr:unnamed protein product [Chironomus riparius]